MNSGWSPLAERVPGTLDPAHGLQRTAWGVCYHTSGRGVVTAALAANVTPIAKALEIYLRSHLGQLHPWRWGGPTYVMDHDGSLHQLTPDEVQTVHAGGPDRAVYLNGLWEREAPPEMVKRWHEAWPAWRSPQNLYPSRSANTDYVGVEMLPIVAHIAEPMRHGLLFTQAQHDSAIALARDLAARHRWPARWERTPRLVGHEDVQPLERSDPGGGWDPGSLREHPYFDFEYIRTGIGKEA